jgi:hypothetical protein
MQSATAQLLTQVADEIKTTIEAAIADEIGTYTIYIDGGNTTTTPAIAVEWGNPDRSAIDVQGLEVIIEPRLNVAISPLMARSYRAAIAIGINLRQWDITKTAIDPFWLLTETAPELNMRSIVQIPRIEPLDNLDEVRAEIPLDLMIG